MRLRKCSLVCLLSGTGILCRAHRCWSWQKRYLPRRGAKELTQDSLFSPKLLPVLVLGRGSPSRSALEVGVRGHAGSLEVGVVRGIWLLPQVAPLYPELGGCRERLCDGC